MTTLNETLAAASSAAERAAAALDALHAARTTAASANSGRASADREHGLAVEALNALADASVASGSAPAEKAIGTAQDVLHKATRQVEWRTAVQGAAARAMAKAETAWRDAAHIAGELSAAAEQSKLHARVLELAAERR